MRPAPAAHHDDEPSARSDQQGCGPMGGPMRAARGLVAVAVITLLGGPGIATPAWGAPGAPRGPEAATPGPMPFRGLAGAHLEPTVETSKDAKPVHYVIWRGVAPSFDGLPLSVDVTVPCDVDGAAPLVVLPHGFTDDKTVWEETGKSDTVVSKDRPAANSRWNNIWFASQGDTVLTYTARGWHDSCGPDTAGHTATAPAPQCADHQY